MRLIFKIARTELRNLFYSPVAWFLSIAFLIQCALFYTGAVERIAKWQELMIKNSPQWNDFGSSLTKVIFLNPDSIFVNAISNLYLFIPLLTMGLVSREINNGTIKLLYSSPIKTRHIVFGKYLAILIYNLLLVSIIGIFMVTGLLNIKNVDTGLVLSAALGFYLLVCAFSAIGIFMSSLSTYQIVSAIATFILIFILTRIGGLWQKYDFIRDITYFLSMTGRTGKMVGGLITSSDVIYFLVVVYMFLSFTLFRLKGAREFKPWYTKAFRYTAVTISALVIGYFSSRPGMIGYWDTTRDNINTIHPNTQQVIKGFEKDEPLEITLYGNVIGRGFPRGGLPEMRNDYMWNLWEKYLRFKPDIKFNFVNYYDVKDGDSMMYKTFPGKTLKEMAQTVSQGLGVDFSKLKTPEEVRKVVDLQPENVRVVMHLKYKGRSTFLRTFDDGPFWPGEMEVSAAFKKLQQAEMPKVLYTTGNLERDIFKIGEREYNMHTLKKDHRVSMINLGFEPDTISLDNRDIPAGISSLVVADPKTALSPVKQEKIRQFIAGGGNVFFLSEPGKQQILNPVLADLGVQLSGGQLVQLSKDEMPHMIRPYITQQGADMAEDNMLLALKEKKGKDTVTWLFPGAAEVAVADTAGFTILPFLVTSPGKVYNKAGQLVTDSLPPVFSPQDGDIRKESFNAIVGLTRKINNKEQRILISGDADLLSSLRSGALGLGLAFYSWLDLNRFPIYAPETKPIDVMLTISDNGGKAQTIFFVWILPSLVLALGIVILIRRKRK